MLGVMNKEENHEVTFVHQVALRLNVNADINTNDKGMSKIQTHGVNNKWMFLYTDLKFNWSILPTEYLWTKCNQLSP